MSDKFNEKVIIIKQEQLAIGVYSMWIKTDKIAKAAVAGQFISIYCNDGSRMLPRPISICEVNKEEGSLRVVYRTLGKGTEEFAKYKSGDSIHIMGPLGNGFPLINKKALLIGGGIGIPPMLELSKELDCEKQIVVGYRDELFLQDDLNQYGQIYVATEDGSHGTKGNVLDAIRENGLDADVIYACGPTPMLRAIKEYAANNNIEAWLSLEEKMACGIGACLACVCKTKELDSHTNVMNTRVCKEGPVFLAQEVEL
jgi:dihydroorotate dehydrogenase electron transfer subunit